MDSRAESVTESSPPYPDTSPSSKRQANRGAFFPAEPDYLLVGEIRRRGLVAAVAVLGMAFEGAEEFVD